MQKLYIHIGYPKTGTSFLQHYVLPDIDSINFIGKWNHPVIKELGKVCNQDDFNFDPESVRNTINAHLKPGINLISFESLIGEVYLKLINSGLIAERLSQLFPEAGIIVTLRNQYDLLDSLYKQYINQGGTRNFKAFIGYKDRKFTPSYSILDYQINPEMFKYPALLNRYGELFGKSNVHVLLYEDLKNNPHKFVQKMLEIMEITDSVQFENKTSNQSLGKVQTGILRLCNRFLSSSLNQNAIIPFPSVQRKLRLLLQSRISLSVLGSKKRDYPDIRAELKEYYTISNQEVAAGYELNMDDHKNNYFA